MPVQFASAGNVTGLVQQHVLIGLQDDQIGIIEMFDQPRDADQRLRVGVFSDFGRRVGGQTHEAPGLEVDGYAGEAV